MPVDKRLMIKSHESGAGVTVQRINIPHDKRPYVNDRGGGRLLQPSGAQKIGSGERLLPWFLALGERLAHVIVLDRSWESALTPTLLMDTPSAPSKTQAIFLDPPYEHNDRSTDIYQSDRDGDLPARASYEWALEHGDRYRIAYAAHADDFAFPTDWREKQYRIPGRRRDVRHESIYFSPACLDPNEASAEQGVLL